MFFFVINALIALCYGLLAFFFARRVRLPRASMRAGWRTVVALVFAAMFFIGCAHTHTELAVLAYQDGLNPHWTEWHTIMSHSFQAVGGLGFFILASKWVTLNIFDRHAYEETLTRVEKEIENGDERH